MPSNLKCTLCKIIDWAESVLENPNQQQEAIECLEDIVKAARKSLILDDLYRHEENSGENKCELLFMKKSKE